MNSGYIKQYSLSACRKQSNAFTHSSLDGLYYWLIGLLFVQAFLSVIIIAVYLIQSRPSKSSLPNVELYRLAVIIIKLSSRIYSSNIKEMTFDYMVVYRQSGSERPA